MGENNNDKLTKQIKLDIDALKVLKITDSDEELIKKVQEQCGYSTVPRTARAMLRRGGWWLLHVAPKLEQLEEQEFDKLMSKLGLE